MLSRASKLRLRRRLRMQKHQVGQISAQAEQHLEKNFFRRLERLVHVRRFIASWMLLIILLISVVIAQTRALGDLYQVSVPTNGGTYREGVIGEFTNANPIYASGLVDASVSRLVFAGLLKYNGSNKLVGDLAQKWERNSLGDVFTVTLKPGLTWHDGEPLTAHDAVFTYNVIKNPDANSPLRTAWQNIKVTAVDDQTIRFELPNPLASFEELLVTGLIPKHVLGSVSMADMRSASFNTTAPVGAGPFAWEAIEVIGSDVETRQERIALDAFEDYNGGAPRINSFVMVALRNEQQLIESFEKQEINAMAGLNTVPAVLANDPAVRKNNMLLTAQVMSFFRNSHEILKDVEVRKALVRGADTISIIRDLSFPTIAVRSPLLSGQLGYDSDIRQLGYNPQDAKVRLSKNGWKPGPGGIRVKDGKPLSFSLHTQDTPEYIQVAEMLQKQWRAIGADVNLVFEDDSALQNTMAYHAYDALLYGISIGPDPDVFVYWHSSQADERLASRLNFSEYDSAVADTALADARTRLNPQLRAAKLQPFLEAWRDDAPALGLYQPRFLYITRGEVRGLTTNAINNDAQRFADVEKWAIRTTRETPNFSE
jgi:peptide/nickel transport system substrate-binding protein